MKPITLPKLAERVQSIKSLLNGVDRQMSAIPPVIPTITRGAGVGAAVADIVRYSKTDMAELLNAKTASYQAEIDSVQSDIRASKSVLVGYTHIIDFLSHGTPMPPTVPDSLQDAARAVALGRDAGHATEVQRVIDSLKTKLADATATHEKHYGNFRKWSAAVQIAIQKNELEFLRKCATAVRTDPVCVLDADAIEKSMSDRQNTLTKTVASYQAQYRTGGK